MRCLFSLFAALAFAPALYGSSWQKIAGYDFPARDVVKTPTTLVVFNEERGVFVHTDSSASWVHAISNNLASYDNSFGGFNLIVRMAYDNGAVYVPGRGRVFMSTDGGNVWHSVALPYADANVRLVHANAGRLFADTGAIYYTDDSGSSWRESVSTMSGRPVSLRGDSTLLLRASANSGYLEYSPNNGYSFSTGFRLGDSGFGLLGASDPPNLADAFKINNRVVLASQTEGVWISETTISSEYGAPRFMRSNTGLTNLNARSLILFGTNLYVATDGGGVFQSSNGGLTWSQFGEGLSSANVYSLCAADSYVYAGTSEGVYRIAAPIPRLVVEQPLNKVLANNVTTNSFGGVLTNSTTVALTYTIRNTGAAPLNTITVSLTGTHTNQFVLTPPSVHQLAPDASTTFAVAFRPQTAGNKTAQVSITSNDTNNNPFFINLQGYGLATSGDFDSDGLNDAAEVSMRDLGFNWQTPQPALVSALFDNAHQAGLYTSNSVTTGPSAFGLFTLAQFNANRTNGRTDVMRNPSAYSLLHRTNVPTIRLASKRGNTFSLSLPGSWTRYAQSGMPRGWTFDAKRGILRGTMPQSGMPSVRLTPYRGSSAGAQVTVQFQPTAK